MISFAVSQHLLNERGKGKVAERQRERERGVSVRVCECRPVLATASVNIHHNTLRERGREHIETHMINTMGIKQCGGLFD